MECGGDKKLCLDFRGVLSVCLQMARASPQDDDVRELVVSLLTRVGMIMEDASSIAILAAHQGTELAKTIEQLDEASNAIGVLIRAAKVLVRT